jgi:hypothetical protein
LEKLILKLRELNLNLFPHFPVEPAQGEIIVRLRVFQFFAFTISSAVCSLFFYVDSDKLHATTFDATGTKYLYGVSLERARRSNRIWFIEHSEIERETILGRLDGCPSPDLSTNARYI